MRGFETRLVYATLAAITLYFPLETWVSLRAGLLNPFYMVDLIAMGLLLLGAVYSLRARPRSAPGLLCAGLAWTAANGWRATFDRVALLSRGGELDFGAGEMWAVAIGTTFAIVAFALSLVLVMRAERTQRRVFPTPEVQPE